MAIYLDNSATTKVFPAAIRAAAEAMETHYGNPSSLHRMGMDAENCLAESRKSVAKLIGCDAEQLYFTGSATESNNIALLGGTAANFRRGNEIVTTAMEHPSVLEPLRHLEEEGYRIIRLKPEQGTIPPEQVIEAVNENTLLVSTMLVNHEVGIRLPVEEIGKAVRRKNPNVLFHIDAAQGAGKIPFSCRDCDPDFVTLSGHKLYAPKGIGALYIKKGVRVKPLLYGGGQEQGVRPGTENVPLAAAFAAAAEEYLPQQKQHYWHYEKCNRHLREGLAALDGAVILSPADAVPYICNFAVPGFRSEILLHFLEEKEIYVSSGSACAKGAKSPVLEAMNIPAKTADCALRVSFSPETTEQEIDELLEALHEATKKLIRMR